MTYPSGAIVTYLRDANGQITGVSAKPTATGAQVTLVSGATYLPFGPLNTLTFGNGRVVTKAYDQNYGIDKVSDAATGGISEDFTVDVVGNINKLVERTNATANATPTFTYDGQDRLTALKNGTTVVQGFTYDATGNRLSKNLSGTITTNTIAPTSHRLTQTGTTVLTYDANGNQTKNGTPAFVYDDRNRLRDYKANGTALTRTYRYNGKGERVSKTVAAGDTNNRYYTYDESGHLLGEYLASGLRVQEYVWMDDTLVAVFSDHDATTYQYVQTDHLGTPRAVINPVSNAIIWRWNLTNTAFGEHAPTADPDGNSISYTFSLRYPGQWYDSESKLHYNYFRDYDPANGRYVESDPIGHLGGVSTFSYVKARPLLARDALGLSDLILFELGSQSYQFAALVPSPPGVIVVAAHCNPQICIDGSGNIVTPNDMARMIRDLKRWRKGMTVRLDGCNAGLDPENGNPSYAQLLANELKVDTLGPNDFIFQNKKGRPLIASPSNPNINWKNWVPGAYIGGPNTARTGSYIRFGPQP